MAVDRHLLTFQAASVHCQLHLVAIAVDPDRDFFSFVTVKIPVWKNVKYRLVCPPGFQIISLVLRETAIIEDTEL
jgi:hypothetical protein